MVRGGTGMCDDAECDVSIRVKRGFEMELFMSAMTERHLHQLHWSRSATLEQLQPPILFKTPPPEPVSASSSGQQIGGVRLGHIDKCMANQGSDTQITHRVVCHEQSRPAWNSQRDIESRIQRRGPHRLTLARVTVLGEW